MPFLHLFARGLSRRQAQQLPVIAIANAQALGTGREPGRCSQVGGDAANTVPEQVGSLL